MLEGEFLFPNLAALMSAAFLLLGAGCSTFPVQTPRTEALALGAQHGFLPREVASSPFQLLALVRATVPSRQLVVYLEGDGAPWLSPYTPPRDPSPHKPLVLSLAIADPADAVAYLGRPCQYLSDEIRSQCSAAYWLERRFSDEVIAAYDLALSALKVHAGAQQLVLVGYSGGGVLATLLAARRKDVAFLATIAAPLALSEWVRLQDISPLSGSLDPADDRGALPPAIHWSGSADKIVPPIIAEKFVSWRGGHQGVMADFTHECCWVREWPRLRKEFPQ